MGSISEVRVFMVALRMWPAAVLFIVVFSLPFVAASAAPREPGAFIDDLGNRAINLLADKTASVSEQRTRFRDLLREAFATRAIGYFVIGKYRRGATRKTVNEFVNTFENYVIALYSSQFRKYSGETFKVIRVIRTNRPSDSIVVTHILRPNGTKVYKIAFQVRQRLQKPSKILDIKIQGISMILAQREEFTGFISQNDGKLEALIDVLKTRVNNLNKKASNEVSGDATPGIPGIKTPKKLQKKKRKNQKTNEEELD